MVYEKRVGKDWGFTNKVHDKYAVKVYSDLGIENVKKASRKEDLENGIDYVGEFNGNLFTFQERFRNLDKNTENSFEFTLRYERPESLSQNQKKSEFFKIKADRLLYGILDAETFEKSTGFKRYCIINLKEIFRAIENKDILIDENNNLKNVKHKAYINKDNKPCAIIKPNKENAKSNSTFVIFDVIQLCETLKDYSIVKEQRGYFEELKKSNKPRY